MQPMTVKEIAAAVAGVWWNPKEDVPPVTAVCTDSRKITPGCLFLPWVGEKFDGHHFIDAALDAGAEDFIEEEDSFEILTDPDSFSEIRLALEDAGIPMVSAEVTMIPQTYVELTDEKDIKNIQKTLDLLEEDDDVQEVYHNWDE